MDKETPKPKIERREGKIFVEGEKHAYMQGMIRHFYLSAKELCFHRSISHDFDKGVAHASFSLIGKATVDEDSLGIIGNKKVQSRDLSLTLRPWPKDETPDPDEKKTEHKSIRDRHTAERKHGPWRGVIGLSTIGKLEDPMTGLQKCISRSPFSTSLPLYAGRAR
jgi:hypothetical protein